MKKPDIQPDRKILDNKELARAVREITAAGGSMILNVTGSSMMPTLKHLRDRVRLVSPETRKPGKREIILFVRPGGQCVLHRIIGENRDGSYLVNGDAQNWTETVGRDMILAVVSDIERNGRWFSCSAAVYRLYAAAWGKLMRIRPRIFAAVNRFACLRRHHHV